MLADCITPADARNQEAGIHWSIAVLKEPQGRWWNGPVRYNVRFADRRVTGMHPAKEDL
jgi:hypothetical protein